MATVDVKVPSVGESVTEGVLSRWLKKDGEQVEEGEPIFELETDKINTEVPAEKAGVLKHKAKEGEEVSVGDTVATIDTDGEAKPAEKEEKEEKKEEKKEPKKEEAKKDKEEKPAEKEKENGRKKADKEPKEERYKGRSISPLAKRIAEEHDADLSGVEGSGPGGRITKEDVLKAVEKAEKKKEEGKEAAPKKEEKPAAKPSPAPARAEGERREREERKAMSPLRRRIAQRLVDSQRNTATLTTFNEADMSEVVAARKRYKEAFQKKHGVGLGFMSFFVKASIEALKSVPAVNARIDGNDIVYQNYYDIGVAVSTDRGLVVPVIRDADRLSFAEIEKRIVDYATRAREGKIELDEIQGGTFTITNGGVFGSLINAPILNPPQSGILGMNNIQERPVARDGEVVIRPMMYISLSYDHRIVDGRESVTFLKRIKECIEDPSRILLDI